MRKFSTGEVSPLCVGLIVLALNAHDEMSPIDITDQITYLIYQTTGGSVTDYTRSGVFP